MVIALLAVALAAEPASDAAAEEIIVYGEILVEQARQEVVRRLRMEGFTEEIDKGDHTIYRHEEAWKGEVVLYDDGWMMVKRQPVRFEGREVPWAKKNSALAWAGCAIYPWLCLRSTGATLGHRKWLAQESRTVESVQPDVRVYSERVADLATDRKVEGLPARLEALWDHGVPLDGDVPLPTPEARRAALLAYWGSRTETPWGDEVREAVEAFCRAVVQASDHPFTAAEIAAFNARASRQFALE